VAQNTQISSLALHHDEGPAFPYAGAALLLVLMAVALWARFGRGSAVVVREGKQREWSFLRRLSATVTASVPASPLTVQASVNLDPQTRVHVVQWRNRQWLVATSAHAPVLLGTDDVPVSPDSLISESESAQ
jgi:hypothetical protein